MVNLAPVLDELSDEQVLMCPDIMSTGFSGALDCPGIRKSVKFPLAAKPFTVEVSGVEAPELSLIVSPE